MKKIIKKSLLFMLSVAIVFSSLNVNVHAETKYGNDYLAIQIIEKDEMINIGIGELNSEVLVQTVTYIDKVVNYNENKVYSFDIGEETKPVFVVQYTVENKPEEYVINYQREELIEEVLIEELPEEEILSEELTDEDLVQIEVDKLTPEELERLSGVDDRSWETEEVENPVEYIESEYDEYIEMDDLEINPISSYSLPNTVNVISSYSLPNTVNVISSYSLPNTVNVIKSNRYYGNFEHWRMQTHPNYHPSWHYYDWNWGDLTVNGELVFCLNPEVKIPNGNGYNATNDWEKLSVQQQNRIMLIGVYGSSYPGQNTELFKIAEQAMTWEVVHHGSKWNKDVSAERAIINRRIADHTKTLKINGTTQKVSVGETYTLTDPLLQDFTVKVGTGIKIVSNSGNTLKYKIESAKFDNTIIFSKKSGKAIGKSVIYKKPGNQDILAVRNSDPRVATLKLELSSSNYNIKKTDESGNPVSGAVYGMSYSNAVDANGFLNTSVSKYTTGSNGQTPVGVWNKAGSTIYYQEMSAPNPFILDKTIRKHVTVGGETRTFSVTNKKATGTIEVIKKDNNGKLYAGAQYRIKNANGSVVATITTNVNGSAKTGALPLGVYTVEEIKAPVPLILNSTPQTVRLTYKDQNTSVVSGVYTQTNLLAQGRITITKVDETGKKYAGAVYVIKNSSGIEVNRVTTNQSGVATSKNLPLGEYTVTEITAPKPLVLDSTPKSVRLAYLNQNTAIVSQSVTQVNKQVLGTISIIKRDTNGKQYGGASYQIKNNLGTVVDTVTTNATSAVKTKNLPLGRYTVNETFAPNPLILDKTPRIVDLTYLNQNTAIVNQSVSQVNKIAVGRISVTKVDESGVKYSGAVFVIKNSSGTEVDRISTNANGLATSKDLPLGNYTVTEVTAPKPLLLEATPRSVSLVYKDQNTAIVSTGFTKSNKKPTGTLTITKKSESGVVYAGVKYEVKNSTGKVVATPVTGTGGSVQVKSLPLGNYTVKETSVPKELILDSVPKNVTIAYKDQVTPVIYVSSNFVNRYQPIVTYGIEKIQIDTQKQSSGLNVKTWFSKVQHYDYSLNNFGEEIITLELVDTNSGNVVSNKLIKIKDLALQYEFKVAPTDLKVNSSSNYEVRINTKAPNKIIIKQQKLATHGYTASQKLLKHHADNKQKILEKSVIRTERSYARSMVTYYETTEITYEQIQPQRTGRGFEYNITALYKNDLNNNYNFHFDFMPDKKLVDSSYLPYSNQANPVFNLVKSGNVYTLPKVRTEVRTGEVISEENWLKLDASKKARYLDGGNKLYVPIWSTDLGSYNTQLKSKSIGVNEIHVEINDYANLFGFMFGWYDTKGISPSSKHDGIVTSPVLAHNPFPTGIPDNWGFSQSNGKKALTSVEQEFFGQKSDYSVRYNLNGGTGISVGDMVKNGGTHTVTDKVPVKTGSRFIGWELNGVTITSGQKITVNQDLNIQALWKEGINRVEFNTNGGSSIDAVTVEYGTTVIKPINPTKEGWTFKGWSPDINQVIVSDTTFSAIWEIDSFKVTFDTGGGTVIKNQSIKYGEYIDIPDNPVKVGSTFTGWLPSLSDQIQSDTKFEAQWEDNYYVVSFDTQSEEMIDAQSIKHGHKIEVPETPTRLGHTFLGWDTATNLLITENTTFKALWEINTFTVMFNTNGGNKMNSQIIEYGDIVEVPEEPFKKGFEFISWDRELYSEITEDTTFNALWGGKNYSVFFDTDGGTPIDKQTISYGDKVQLPEEPTKVGSTFVGWEPNIETEIKTDTVFKAIWSSADYQVSFDTDGGSKVETQYVPHGEQPEKPVQPTKEGFTFVEWDKKFDIDIVEDTVFTAIWIENNFTVYFDSVGGSNIESQQATYDTIINPPNDPLKTGYEFKGWEPSIDTKITEDTVFVAQWELLSYLVKFDTDGGTIIKDQVINHGESVEEPEDPIKEGYSFIEWDKGLELGIEEHTVFKAVWSINTYSVVYVFNNGQSSIEEVVEHGAIPKPMKNPEKEDFTFVEWLPSLENPILEDTEFVAQWEINGHKVQFKSGTDTQIDYQIVVDGEKANDPNVELEREGYTFVGWSPVISETTILSEVTFNAVWEKTDLDSDIVSNRLSSELFTDRFRKWWITPDIRKRK